MTANQPSADEDAVELRASGKPLRRSSLGMSDDAPGQSHGDPEVPSQEDIIKRVGEMIFEHDAIRRVSDDYRETLDPRWRLSDTDPVTEVLSGLLDEERTLRRKAEERTNELTVELAYLKALGASRESHVETPAQMTESVGREEIDAKVAASEARQDTKLATAMGQFTTAVAELRGDIRELKGATAGKTTIIISAIALFAALAAVMIGLSTLGWQGFGTGLSAHDIASQAATDAIKASCKPSANHPC